MNAPLIVRLSIEHARAEILVALSKHAAEVQGEAEAAVAAVVRDFDFRGELAKITRETLRKTLEHAVESAMLRLGNDPRVLELAREVVLEALKAGRP